ncbi:MAG: D-glycero-beta-D-manno-heptose-7-phosphate kinase [Deferrisomatales bacterium]|nr:D-glycero-beta-D-manno-heptose-7-phosphate kinase [Deferrisomatales bacterium]
MTSCDAAAGAALSCLHQHLSTLRVGVVGDVVLDRFLYGAVDRISPEAPVPVVDVEREVYRLGGAANVVHNIVALGGGVEVFGVVGADAGAGRLRQELETLGAGQGGLLEVAERPTAVKTRVIAQHQQVVRFDREWRGPLPQDVTRNLLDRLLGGLGALGAVIVSDYGKGVVGPELMTALVEGCRAAGIPLAVDPKPVNAGLYRGVSVMTPNTKETEALVGFSVRTDADAARAGAALLERFAGDAMLVTRGERGMTLVERDREAVHIGTRARDVFDVTGAGDTTIAALALARAAGCSYRDAACLANAAAGLVVAKLGTAVVGLEELGASVGWSPPPPPLP